MKVYISVDMEGMAGITAPFQEKEEVASFRRALHNQIRWIIDGIHESTVNGQIEEITIADSHGSGTNLSYDELCAMDERISLVSGSPRKHFMMSCLDETYDVVFLAGYHAGPGEPFANMDHSFSGRAVSYLKINGIYMNESTTNAALAGDYGVPVGLVVGDSGLRAQLIDQKMMPWVEFVTTKESLSRYAAKFPPQKKLREDTVAAVKKVLESDPKAIPVYRVEAPIRLSIDFKTTAMAEMVAQLPMVERVSGTEAAVTCRDMTEVECAISAITGLAGIA
ncbi:MAG: M55 family metallopeptidase [Lachnospiraceae bacterium]